MWRVTFNTLHAFAEGSFSWAWGPDSLKTQVVVAVLHGDKPGRAMLAELAWLMKVALHDLSYEPQHRLSFGARIPVGFVGVLGLADQVFPTLQGYPTRLLHDVTVCGVELTLAYRQGGRDPLQGVVWAVASVWSFCESQGWIKGDSLGLYVGVVGVVAHGVWDVAQVFRLIRYLYIIMRV